MPRSDGACNGDVAGVELVMAQGVDVGGCLYLQLYPLGTIVVATLFFLSCYETRDPKRRKAAFDAVVVMLS